MCQSFFVVILGVFTYIFRDAYKIIQLIIELLFLVFVTELFITTLNFKEVVRLGKGALKNSLNDEPHLQNIYIKIKGKPHEQLNRISIHMTFVSSQVKCTLFRQQMHTFSAPVF